MANHHWSRSAGEASVTPNPRRTSPWYTCARPTTRLPRLATTLIATSGSSRAAIVARSMTFTERAGTGYPWSSAGSREPSSVANPMSTIADSSYGLVRTSCSRLPSAVKPSARYHDGAGALAHAATDVPSGWTAACSTSPPPPSISTIALTKSRGEGGVDVDDRAPVWRHGDRLLDGLAGSGEQRDPGVER